MENSDMNFEVEPMKLTMITGKTVLVGLVFAALIGGCASPTSEDDFGNSVRRMIDAQKYIPPEQEGREVPMLDGEKAEASIKQYRSGMGSQQRMDSKMGGYDSAVTSQ